MSLYLEETGEYFDVTFTSGPVAIMVVVFPGK